MAAVAQCADGEVNVLGVVACEAFELKRKVSFGSIAHRPSVSKSATREPRSTNLTSSVCHEEDRHPG